MDAPAWKLLDAFATRRAGNLRSAALLKLAPDVQRRRHLLNSAITLAARPRAHGFETALKRIYLNARHSVDPTRSGRFLWQMYRRSGRALTQLTGPVAPWMNVKRGRTDLAIVVRAEQAPNFDSRVLLINGMDQAGYRASNWTGAFKRWMSARSPSLSIVSKHHLRQRTWEALKKLDG